MWGYVGSGAAGEVHSHSCIEYIDHEDLSRTLLFFNRH